MARQTSIDCYHAIKEGGLLSNMRMRVYEAILYSAPCTSAEAMKGILNSGNVLSQSRARFTELRDMGVICEKGIKKCSVTGRNAIVWDLTDNLPKEQPKKLTIKQKLKELRTMIDKAYSKADLFIQRDLSEIKEYMDSNF